MALAADLIGLDASGQAVWCWMAKNWSGIVAAEAVALSPGDWPSSWRGPVSAQEVSRLRGLFGGKAAELAEVSPSPDLDELLERPRASLLLVVEEWGY